jgi:endonuclease/exonuclease/phosphatase family metal-dependent hydrolase
MASKAHIVVRPPASWYAIALLLAGPALAGCLDLGLLESEGPPPGASGGGGDGDATGAAGGTGGGGAPSGDGGMAIVTWNVQSFPLTTEAPALAAKIIGELHPDVVALQEIEDVGAFQQLVMALAGYEGVLNDDPGGYQRLGLLHRTDRASVTEVETLFQDDWYAFPRPPLKARVELTSQRGERFDFVIVVVHLKAQLDGESWDRRRAACERLETWVSEQQAAGPEQDFVVLGDFNDRLTAAPPVNVFLPFLEAPDRYAFLTLPAAEAGDFSYIPFKSLIDHILVTDQVLAAYGDGATASIPLEADYPSYGDALSDHRPVRARFAFGP